MYKDIIRAIEYLPEDLVNDQIVEAGLENGDIKLLDYLPEKYLIPRIILQIVEKNQGYGSFDLARIPEKARIASVCELAVKKDTANFREVPASLRSGTMLDCLMSSAKSVLSMLPLIPADLWNTPAVYAGIATLYRSSDADSYSYSYSRRRNYSSCSHRDTDGILRSIQVLLSYVPAKLKTRQFYLGLFDTKMDPEYIDRLTPGRFKQNAFYTRMARRDFKRVPASRYNYNLLLAALRSPQGISLYDVFDKDKPYTARFISSMDDAMADAIIDKGYGYFERLPDAFRTEARLLRAIDRMDQSRGDSLIDPKKDARLLTPAVCRALVKKDLGYPTFPNSVWDTDFVRYCVDNGLSFRWFRQMPGHLQTAENTALAMDKDYDNIEYVRAEFIPLQRAQDIYRRDLLRHPCEDTPPVEKYIPHHYLSDFTELTGLPHQFFGGETTLSELREHKTKYSFCRLGDAFIGIYSTDRYESQKRLVLTRRTPDAVRPQQVFDRPIGTFHTTWLEKMIADYDRTFVKPTVSKKLKALQVNPYYDLQFEETRQGLDIYRNTFLGGTVCYTALRGEEVVREDRKEDIHPNEIQAA